MLRATWRLIRADLAQRPFQAVLTGLVIAIATAALLVTLHLRAVLDQPFDELMRATNGAHVTLTGPPAQIRRAAARPGVARASELSPLAQVSAGVGRERGHLVLGTPHAHVDRPLLTEGRLPRTSGEVLASRQLALGMGLHPGGELVVGGRRLRVVGVGALALANADAWVTPPLLKALAHGRAVAEISLRLSDPNAAAAFAATPQVRVDTWLDARRDYSDESRRTLAILGTSTLLALLAAGFTLATAIGGRVLADRRRIGLLRAVGVTPRGVTGVLVSHYVAIALLALPFGLLAGRLIAPPLVSGTLTLLGTPQPGPPGPARAGLVAALVVAAVVVATALPAWRAGRLPPVVALEPVRSAASERASRAARIAQTLRAPVVAVLGAKDAYVQRARALLTIASLALAAMMVVCALAFEATMDRLAADPALRAQPWDVAVDSEGMPAAQVDRALAAVPGVATVGRRYDILTTSGGVELETRVIDGPPSAFAFSVPDGRGVQRPGEVTLGREAIERLGLKIGDEVRMAAAGRPFTARLVGRHVEPDADGLGAVMLAGTAPAAALERPRWILRLAPDADPARVEDAIARRGGGRLFAGRPLDSLQAEVDRMRPIVYSVTALLLAIAAVNLLTTLLLGVRERRRDVAILGAVGATRRQVAGTVVCGGVVLALPAVLAGLPGGAWMFTTIVGITDPSDGPDVATLPSWWVVVLALPLALAVVAIISAVAAREAQRVAVPVALRAE
jgi:putative ABC transport system permease protein